MESGPGQRFLDGVKERRERHRERHKIVRAAAVLAGFVIVLVGLVMIPLPGPGLPVTAAGLTLLALEFAWAESVLERTVNEMTKATRQSEASRTRSAGVPRAARGARRRRQSRRRVRLGHSVPPGVIGLRMGRYNWLVGWLWIALLTCAVAVLGRCRVASSDHPLRVGGAPHSLPRAAGRPN